jgi:hypothetical protein
MGFRSKASKSCVWSNNFSAYTLMTRVICRYEDLMSGGVLEFTMTDKAAHSSEDRGCHSSTSQRSSLNLPPLRNTRNPDPLCVPSI